MADSSFERYIPFERCFNFRDLGGYRTGDGRTVRWRRLFRSSEIHGMTEADCARARQELGIATVIDLREPGIAAQFGLGPLVTPPVRYHNIPLIEDSDNQMEEREPEPMPTADFYLQLLKQPTFGRRIAEALAVLAEPDVYPAVFHCAAGKDRAGLLAAVVLGVLGVSDEDIARDYALTARYMPQLIDRWWADPEIRRGMEKWPLYIHDARPEAMEDVLATLRRQHGSVRGYLEAQGIGPGAFRRLEDALLE